MRCTFPRESYIPKDATPVTRDGINAIVYTNSTALGRPCAMAFAGKANKPVWNFIFKSEDHRTEYIERYFNSLAKSAKFRQELKAKQKQGAEVFGTSIKPGDYFYTSWGYDQTNIDYLVVVNVSPSRKSVVCQMADAIHVGEVGQSDELMPGTAYGEPFRMQVRDGCLVGSYPFCNGSTRDGHFMKTALGSTHQQTNPMFGH